MTILDKLPERGWGVIRCFDPVVVAAYWAAGMIHVQIVGNGVYQARLTGEGRKYRKRRTT